MSIQSTNIYDLLSADGEGAVLPSKTPAKDSKVEQKAAAPKQSKDNEKKPQVELGKGSKTQDKQKRGSSKPGGGGDRPPREKPSNPNKRVFDRRSGTGRGKETKKGGSGRGNWGNIESKDELVAESAPAVEKEEAPKEPSEVSEEKVATPTEGEKPVEEEEDKTLSYEEWKAKNETKVVELPVPVRQAGEGVDNSAWSEFVPLERERETTEANKKGAEKKKKEAASGASKVRVDEVFKIQVAQEKPTGNRRGGNKRPGTGGRDPSKSFRGRGRPTGKNFSLNEEAFPSLSTKA